jgi:HAD superfamily hydrolase (TIGR01549 family)
MKDYKIYIFDLDGTITDTLSVWLDIFRDGLKTFGVTAPDDKTLSQHTHDWKQMLQLGLPEGKLDDFIALAHTLAKERLPEAPLHQGAYEALRALKARGKRIAIFSTMDRPIFEPAMEHRNLNVLAEVAVAGTDVPKRKPEPDGILKALKDLGVPKSQFSQAVYIGDKDTDIQAANNAGVDGVLYYPIAHQLTYSLEELKKHKPVHVMTDWQEILEPLQKQAATV